MSVLRVDHVGNMDHLPLLEGLVLSHPEIPYCCSDDSSLPIGPFSAYPERRGYSLKGISQGEYDDEEHHRKDQPAQEWLFQSLLSAVLDVPGVEVTMANLTGPGSFYKKAVKSVAIPE